MTSPSAAWSQTPAHTKAGARAGAAANTSRQLAALPSDACSGGTSLSVSPSADRAPPVRRPTVRTDLDRALHVFRRIDASAGTVNDHSAFHADGMPLAGLRRSGLGVGGIPYTIRGMQIDKMPVLRPGRP